MAREFLITLDGTNFAGRTMTAKEQFEALHVIMQRGVTLSAIKEGTTDASGVVALGAIPFAELERLEKLALAHVTRHEDEVPVDRNLFRDRIEQYYLLLARVLQENLKGFWTLRQRADNGEQSESAEQKEAGSESDAQTG